MPRQPFDSPNIRLHGVWSGTAHLLMSGTYVLAKWAVSPLLYLARKLGLPPSIPRAVDAAINRVALPLTERPDGQFRCDVASALPLGGMIPDVAVVLPDGQTRSLRSFRGSPLLLVAIRGSWCSYSRLHMVDLNHALPRMAGAGVRVLAVSSETDPSWWHAHGVTVTLASDPEGAVFEALGIPFSSWMESTWGRVLPHESAFLFDARGRLIAADTRRVSGVRLHQTFLGADQWLATITAHGKALHENQ